MELESPVFVTSIILANRRDCCQELMNPSMVSILNENRQVIWEKQITTTAQIYQWDNI